MQKLGGLIPMVIVFKTTLTTRAVKYAQRTGHSVNRNRGVMVLEMVGNLRGLWNLYQIPVTWITQAHPWAAMGQGGYLVPPLGFHRVYREGYLSHPQKNNLNCFVLR